MNSLFSGGEPGMHAAVDCLYLWKLYKVYHLAEGDIWQTSKQIHTSAGDSDFKENNTGSEASDSRVGKQALLHVLLLVP